MYDLKSDGRYLQIKSAHIMNQENEHKAYSLTCPAQWKTAKCTESYSPLYKEEQSNMGSCIQTSATHIENDHILILRIAQQARLENFPADEGMTFSP